MKKEEEYFLELIRRDADKLAEHHIRLMEDRIIYFKEDQDFRFDLKPQRIFLTCTSSCF